MVNCFSLFVYYMLLGCFCPFTAYKKCWSEEDFLNFETGHVFYSGKACYLNILLYSEHFHVERIISVAYSLYALLWWLHTQLFCYNQNVLWTVYNLKIHITLMYLQFVWYWESLYVHQDVIYELMTHTGICNIVTLLITLLTSNRNISDSCLIIW